MKPLYEITAEIALLLEQTDEDGVLLPAVEEQLDSLQITLEHKIDNCCRAVKNAEAEAAMLKEEFDRLHKRVQVANGRALRLKNYVKGNLQRLNIGKLEAGTFKVRIQRNSMPLVEFTGDPAALPPEFQRVKIELNNEAAREAAKAGKELPPGVRVEVGSHLRIS